MTSSTQTPSSHSSERDLAMESVKNCKNVAFVQTCDLLGSIHHLNRYIVSSSHPVLNSYFDSFLDLHLSQEHQFPSSFVSFSRRMNETSHSTLPYRSLPQ